MRKLKLLDDKDWLSEKYRSGCSLAQIAKQAGAKSHVSVLVAFRKHGIETRSKGDGQRLRYNKRDFFQVNRAVIDGCLLGDACLAKENKHSDDSAPIFRKKNLYHDHILLVAKLLFGQNASSRVTEVQENGNSMFTVTSLTHPEQLEPFYRRWYPKSNNFSKVIPVDISISPAMMLHWFLDDGYSYWASHKNGKRKYLRVEFATQCFNESELGVLAESVLNVLNIRMAVRIHRRHGKIRGTGCEMHVQQKDVPAFFDVIGPCPVPSLSYKWKLP